MKVCVPSPGCRPDQPTIVLENINFSPTYTLRLTHAMLLGNEDSEDSQASPKLAANQSASRRSVKAQSGQLASVDGIGLSASGGFEVVGAEHTDFGSYREFSGL